MRLIALCNWATNGETLILQTIFDMSLFTGLSRSLLMLVFSFGCLESRAQLILNTGSVSGEPENLTQVFAGRGNPKAYQWVAGKISLGRPATIAGIEGWIQAANGLMEIRVSKPNAAGLPGTTLFSAVSDLAISPNYPTDEWRGIGGLNWSLQAGEYWILFAPPVEGGFRGLFPASVPHPLSQYASFYGYVPGWLDAPNLNFGVRIFGEAGNFSPIPEPATYGWISSAMLGACVFFFCAVSGAQLRVGNFPDPTSVFPCD